jgi:hypothetical protein
LGKILNTCKNKSCLQYLPDSFPKILWLIITISNQPDFTNAYGLEVKPEELDSHQHGRMTVCRWIQSACPWDAHHVAVLLLYPTSPIKQTHTQGWFPQFSHSCELKMSLYRSHDYMYLSFPRHIQPRKLSISQFYLDAVWCLFLGPIYTPWHFTPLICITYPVGRLQGLLKREKAYQHALGHCWVLGNGGLPIWQLQLCG